MFKLHKQEYKNKTKKYIIINKQKGGSAIKPDWYDEFISEIDSIYDDNYVITGSGAVTLYLVYFNNLTNGQFNEFISNLRIPNDVDFVYHCKGANYISSSKLDKYNRIQSVPQRSVTYEFNGLGSIPIFIKSFDLTCLKKINYVKIHKYKVLTLEKLLEYYSQELEDNEMFIRHYETDVKKLVKRIEKTVSGEDIIEEINLEEEQTEMESNLDKYKTNILTLTLKINILNILIKHTKTDTEISSKYTIETSPSLTSPSLTSPTLSSPTLSSPSLTSPTHKRHSIVDTDSESKSDNESSNLFKRLFDFPASPITKSDKDTLKSIDFKGDDSDNEETPIIPRKLESEIPKTTLGVDDKKVSMPIVSRKIDFGFKTPKTNKLKSTSSPDVTVQYEPYEIKFDFEK